LSLALVLLFAQLSGPPLYGDGWLFMTPAAFLAHGNLHCAYPTGSSTAPTAPLLPILVGALAALLRVGSGTPFPTAHEVGPHCQRATDLAYRWFGTTNTHVALMKISFVTWIVLLVGVVSLLRTTSRGRTRWEAVACVACGVVPPIFMTMTLPAHPEYALVVGFVLLAVVALRRGHAAWSGVLLALAFLSQESTLLLAVPLLLVASRRDALRAAVVAVITTGAVVVPLNVLSEGRLFTTLGGTGATLPNGTTWLDAASLTGYPLVAVSRILPLLFAALLTLVVARRTGLRAGGDIASLLRLLAACVDLRLVFEVNLWGYYFMGVATLLVLADVVRGRLRTSLLAWLLVVSVIFNPFPHFMWGLSAPFAPHWASQIALTLWALGLALAPLLREETPSLFGSRVAPAPTATSEVRGPTSTAETS
jgi:hypothetical protein